MRPGTDPLARHPADLYRALRYVVDAADTNLPMRKRTEAEAHDWMVSRVSRWLDSVEEVARRQEQWHLRQQRTVVVEWFAPGTMAGDGLPLRGQHIARDTTPLEAWDAYVREPEAHTPVRAYCLWEGAPEGTTLEQVLVRERLR